MEEIPSKIILMQELNVQSGEKIWFIKRKREKEQVCTPSPFEGH